MRYIVHPKKLVVLCIVVLAIVVVGACRPDSGCPIDPEAPRLAASVPCEAFHADDIAYLASTHELPDSLQTRRSINTDSEKQALAADIKAWQEQHMVLSNPLDHPDVSYPMRWNHVMPGLYPVADSIRERAVVDTADGLLKTYGVCWGFAAVFVAMARYHALELGEDVRISAWKRYMSDDMPHNQRPGADYGLSHEEYSALAQRLDDNGLFFPECQLNAVMVETYIHYRPEVSVGGAWVSFDATGPSGAYLDDSNYQVVEWDEALNADVCFLPYL